MGTMPHAHQNFTPSYPAWSRPWTCAPANEAACLFKQEVTRHAQDDAVFRDPGDEVSQVGFQEAQEEGRTNRTRPMR